jgi:hypothetical protein
MMMRSIKQRILRFFKSAGWQNIEIGLIIVAILVLFPIWMPIAFVITDIKKRQKRKAADRFSCVNCGSILGKVSIDLADAQQFELMQELLREYPGMRLSPPARTVHAICSNCDTKFTYSDRKFSIL